MLEADPLLEVELSISLRRQTAPRDVDATFAAFAAPLLCLVGQADPLFYPERTPALLARFATPDRQLERLEGADYLTILRESAEPMGRWLDEKD
jgi:hypothetical protein